MSKRVALLLAATLLMAAPALADTTPVHGIAIHGDVKYAPDFKHVDYANPDAPKGGEMRLAVNGAFDNLNEYIIKGVSAPGLALTQMTLMDHTKDEPYSEYGLIAESVEVPEDRSSITFNLRKEAKWHDGKPITADDVVWTFNTLVKEGSPFYRAYYANVKEVKAENANRVTFTFSMAGNRELPFIMGELVVLPKHYWEGKKFADTTLTPPLGSGAYKIKSVEAGRRIVYERVKDWWAADLPVNKGQFNFDTLSFDVYRDETVLLQAFFAGEYDFRSENIAQNWFTQYDQQKPLKDGSIVKEEIRHSLPAGLQGFIFNTRRAIFADPKVREALNYAFDFEWSNKQFAFGSYKRIKSFFENSELASSGLPQGRELEILEKYRGQIPDEVFTQEYANPKTDGSGNGVRANIMKGKKLLEEAGWKVGAGGIMEKDGKKLEFEILSHSEAMERWMGPFIGNLKKLGVVANIRHVDTTQYTNRVDSFDFDMITGGFGQSMSPGNEQRDFWGSDKVNVKGSRNTIGVNSKAVDALVNEIIAAPDREELTYRTRALDRVLLASHYVIPQWYLDAFRVAYWNKYSRPPVSPKYGLGVPETWWYDAEKAGKLSKAPPAK
ncbi:MAG: extracellular solute-binding protein [Alphaproteobacteria bacterium]